VREKLPMEEGSSMGEGGKEIRKKTHEEEKKPTDLKYG